MRTLLDRWERIMTLAAAAAAFAMMLLTTADALGRYFLNRPILVALEVTTNYLMVAAIFLALPYTYRQGANIRVTFLADRLRGPVKIAVDYVVQVASTLYCVALVVATIQQARHIVRTGTTFTTVDLPMWPAHVAIAVALFVVAVMMLVDLPEVRRGRSSLFREGG
jgi:TRAP-type C4-dicarboxylate transport system permease small subunit